MIGLVRVPVTAPDRRNERAASDPFLVVVDHDKYGSVRESYWVEVWNEPDYREQRQA